MSLISSSRSISFQDIPRDVLNYMFELFFKPEESIACRFVKLFHNLPTLKQFKKITKQQAIENVSSKQGSISLVKWLVEYLKYPTTTICELASEGGHLHLLQWSRSNGCPWSENTCSNAV